jgi:hypothetical protein
VPLHKVKDKHLIDGIKNLVNEKLNKPNP